MKDPDIDLIVVHRQLFQFAHKDDVDNDDVDLEKGGDFDEDSDMNLLMMINPGSDFLMLVTKRRNPSQELKNRLKKH